MNLTEHNIIFYWNDFAEMLVAHLHKAGKYVVVVAQDQATARSVESAYEKQQLHALHVLPQDVEGLRRVKIEQSASVFLNYPKDTEKLTALLALKRNFPDVRYVVSTENADLKETFYNSGVHYCISREEIAAKMVSSYLFETDAARVFSDLLEVSRTKEELDMQEYKLLDGNPIAGMPYMAAFRKLRTEYGCLLIGFSREGKLYKIPKPDFTIQTGDYAIVIANGATGEQLSKDFQVPEGEMG